MQQSDRDDATRWKESRGAICSECIVAAWEALSLIFRYYMQPRDHANSISLFGGRPRFIVRQMATRNPSRSILDCYSATSLSVSHLLSDVASRVSSYQLCSLLLSAARYKPALPCLPIRKRHTLKFISFFPTI